MKTVALITTSFPPFADSQTIRTLHLVKNVPDHHWVFCVPGDTPRDGNGIDPVWRDFMPASYEMLHVGVPALLVPRPAPATAFGHLVRYLSVNLRYRTAYPDAFRGFPAMAMRALSARFDHRQPDIILSASGSITAHQAAHACAQRYRVPWLADFGDPLAHVDQHLRPWFALATRRDERQIVQACSGILVTTAATRELFVAMYRTDPGNIAVLPYGWIDDAGPAGPPLPGDAARLTLLHLGAAHRANRDLTPLIRAAAQRPRGSIALRIIGNHSRHFETTAAQVGMDVVFHDRVSYQASFEEARNADVQVIVGNKGAFQVPGKVYPAIAGDRVLLYLGQLDPAVDPSWQIMRDLPGILHAPNTAPGIARALEQLQQAWPTLRVGAGQRRHASVVADAESHNLGQHLQAIMSSLSRGEPCASS